MERRWREEDFMPDQIAPEYKEADRRSGPNQENTERARAGVTGHNVRYVLIFGLLAVIILKRNCHYFSVRAVFAASSADSTGR